MPIINPGTGGGSPGPPGPQGIPGINGIPGFDGDSGEDALVIPGSQGAQGSQGTQGVPGINGSQGIPGEDGLSGEDSFIPGPQGLTGASGTIGANGRDGARGLDGEDGLTNDDFWPGFNPSIDDPLEQIPRIQDQNVTILPNYSATINGPYTINPGKKLKIGVGGRFKIEQGAPDASAVVFIKQTSSFGTLSITEVMVGLANDKSTQIVTPKTSGRLFVILSGTAAFATGGLTQTICQMYYGTGTAPVSASAAPPPLGVKIGNPETIQSAFTNYTLGVVIPVLVTNLIVGTPYWFDISSIISGVGGTVTFNSFNFVAIEL